MIETRYRIEYIEPNSNKLSSRLGKFFIYTAFSISILVAIIALVFSNLPNSTSQVITDKVQHFISPLNETHPRKVENDPITPTVELVQQTLKSTQLEKEYKLEIERLSQKNTAQDNETAKQLQANQNFSKRLDQLSTQLKEEKLKNTQLTNKLATLNTENKSVSSLLKETNKKAENYANELKQLKQKETKIVDAIKPLTITSKPSTPKVAENISDDIVKEPSDTEKLEDKVVVKVSTGETTKIIDTKEQITPKVSQMDAIVAAMEAANNTSNTQNTKAINSSEEK